MAEKKLMATAELFLNTKDAKRDAQLFVNDLKQKLNDIETAADKMTVFKDVVEYIAQIDKALAALRKNNKNAFDGIADGLDVNLKQTMEMLLGISNIDVGRLDVIRDKIAEIVNSGKKTGHNDAFKEIARDINVLYRSMGETKDVLDVDSFGGLGKFEEKIKTLTDAVDNFGVSFTGVSSRIADSFGLDGAENISKFGQKLRNELTKVNSEFDKINEMRSKLSDISTMKVKIDGLDNISSNLDESVSSARDLVDTLVELHNKVQNRDAYTDDISYYQDYLKYLEVAKKVKKLGDTEKGMDFLSKQDGSVYDIYLDAESVADDFAKNIKNQMLYALDIAEAAVKAKVRQIRNDAMYGLNLDGGLEVDSKVSQNPVKETISLYDQLSEKVREYFDLRKQISKLDINVDRDEYKLASSKLSQVTSEIQAMKSLTEEDENLLYDVFDEMQTGNINSESAVHKLCNILKIDIPDGANQSAAAAESAFYRITKGANEASRASQKVMYHIGNLLKGNGSPRDTFGDMAYNLTEAALGTRYEQYGFGVLGGGLFGVSDPSTIDHDPKRNSFIQSIDLSKYNMYIADTEERASALINFLSKLQKFSMKLAESNYTGFDTQLQGLDVDSLYDQFKIVFDQSDLTKDKFQAFIDEMVLMLKQAGLMFDTQAGALDFTNISDEIANSDNISTRFMKMLGYDGINIGTTSLDGLGQGSVLFGFNESDIVGYFNTVQDAIQDYQKILNQVNGNEWTGSIEQLNQYAANIDAIINRLLEYKNSGILNDTSELDETLGKLTQIRQNVNAILSGESVGGSNSFTTITTCSAEVGVQIDKAKTKLEAFLALSQEIQNKDFFDAGDASDNIAIGQYTERLEAAKRELDELGRQGILTAEQIELINNVFEASAGHLRVETRHYDGYGSGYGDASSFDLANAEHAAEEAQRRADALTEENTLLREQLELRNQINISASANPAEIYNQSTESVKELLDRLMLAEQKLKTFNERIAGVKLENFNPHEPTDFQRNYILAAYDELKRVQQEIANMPILETEDDKQKLRELQEEALRLYSTIRQANMPDSDPQAYIREYGFSTDEAIKFKVLTEGGEAFKLRNSLLEEYKNEYNTVFNEIANAHDNLTQHILANGEKWSQFGREQLKNLYSGPDHQKILDDKLSATANDETIRQQEEALDKAMRINLTRKFKSAFGNSIKNNLLDDSQLDAYDSVLEEIRSGTITTLDQCINKFEELSGSSVSALASLGSKVNIVKNIANAYDDLADAITDGYDYDKEKEKVEAFEEKYYSLIATMRDGSKVNITLDDEFSDSTRNLLRNAEQIQDIEFVPRSVEGAIKAYEKLDMVFANLTKRWKDPNTLEKAVNSFDLNAIDQYRQYLQSSIDAIKLSDPDFKFGSQEKFDHAVQSLQKLEELSRRINLTNAFTGSMSDDIEWTDKIENAYREVLQGIKNGTYTTVEECEAKFKELSNVVEATMDERAVGTVSAGSSSTNQPRTAAVGGGDTTPNLPSDEISALEILRQKLLEVKAAVDAKTQAFEEEYVTVDGVVDAEKKELEELITVLRNVAKEVGFVASSFSQLNIGTNIESGISQLNRLKDMIGEVSAIGVGSSENPHYLTDSRGNRKLMYRGINGAISGLVSNRYHGGTFFTDLMSLAKRYAGIDGKVESANISMKNPLEIDAHEHQWNDLLYIGHGADEASKKIHQLRADIKELEMQLNGLFDEYGAIDDIDLHAKFSNDLESKRNELKSIYDDSSNPYGKYDTNGLVEYAKSAGYDGVIFRNIKDGTNEISNIVVTLQENQIDFVETFKTNFKSLLTDFIGYFGNIEDFMSHYNKFKTDNSLFPEIEDAGRAIFGEQLDKYEELSMFGEPEIINEFLNKNKILGAYDKRVPGGLNSLLDMRDTDARIDSIVNFYLNAIYELEKIQEAFNTKATSVEQYEREQRGNLTSYDKISTVEPGYSDRKLNDRESYKYADATIEDLNAKKDQAIAAANAFKEMFASLDMGTASPEQLKQVVDSFVNAIKLIDDAQSMATGIIENRHGHPDVDAMRGFHELGPIRDYLTADYLDILRAESKQIEQIEIDMQKAQGKKLKSEQESASAIDQKMQADADIQAEIGQLNQLKAILDEVKNAVLAKTKAFYDEGNVVGQSVGKEISALTKLSEIIDGIVPKVNSLVDGLNRLKEHGIDIKTQDVNNININGNQSTDGTENNKPEDPFKAQVTGQKSALTKYINDLNGVQYVTKDTIEELIGLRDALDAVKTPKDLERIIEEFNNIKNAISIAKASFEKIELNNINDAERKLLASFNTLNSDQKKGVEKDLTAAILQLETYKNAVLKGQKVELSAIEETIRALYDQIEAYKQVNKEAKDAAKAQKKNSKFGDTVLINAAAKHNSLTRLATSDQFVDSQVVSSALSSYEQAYSRMVETGNKLRNKEIISDLDKEGFKELTAECNEYARALDNLLKKSLKLHNTKVNPDDYILGADFVDDEHGRKAALADFARQMYGVNVASTDFKDNFNKVVFAVKNGDGTFTQMTATFTEARNEIVALAGDTKKIQGFFSSFFDGFKGRVKSLAQYFLATISIYDVWRVIKRGVNYVKEIDSALTELKKVTDETDKSYSKFLQDMSKTGSVIGATVKDLTTMAAEWARLNI